MRRSDAFYLALALAFIHAGLLVLLSILAWKTSAVMLFRRDAPPPGVASASPL